MKKVKWTCDFCGEAGLTISINGDVYCRICNKSYHEDLYDLAKKLIKENKFIESQSIKGKTKVNKK